jgi:hypothetical protein
VAADGLGDHRVTVGAEGGGEPAGGGEHVLLGSLGAVDLEGGDDAAVHPHHVVLDRAEDDPPHQGSRGELELDEAAGHGHLCMNRHPRVGGASRPP